MTTRAEKGQTAFYITKETGKKILRPGKTEKEKKSGKHARHLNNLAVRAEQQKAKR